MRTKTPARIDVVRKEEKEAHLIAFIRRDLESARARCSSVGAATSAREYTLVVRSLQSPVASALIALATELAGDAIGVRVIVVQPVLGADVALAQTAHAALLSVVREVRVLRDIRFLDAHEQLWLDADTAWIGDCMRREPGKRDAYECYASDNSVLALWASTSFERLWRQGELLAIGVTPEPAPAEAAMVEPDGVCAGAIAQAEPLGAVEAATRH